MNESTAEVPSVQDSGVDVGQQRYVEDVGQQRYVPDGLVHWDELPQRPPEVNPFEELVSAAAAIFSED